MATTDKPTDRYPDSEGPFAGQNNTFPIGTAARVKNAWARIRQGPTLANHSAAEIADIKAKIRTRAKQLGIVLGEHDDAGTKPALGSNAADSVSSLERCFTGGVVELRSVGGAGSHRIGGYASTFGQRSRLMSFGYETVDRAFFNESKRAGWPDVSARWNHSSFHLLGSVSAGTLRLSVDSTGLEYDVDLPEHRADLFELVARRDVAQSSFCFAEASDTWSYTDGHPLRTLLSGTLVDVAPVGGERAAYTSASVAVRSLARHVGATAAEVEMHARSGELRRFFVRTDIDGGASTKTMSAEQAMALVEARRVPPWVAAEHSHRERMLRLRARRMAWH
jgi:uncharacterized protein